MYYTFQGPTFERMPDSWWTVLKGLSLTNQAGEGPCYPLRMEFVHDIVESYQETSTTTCFAILELIDGLSKTEICTPGLIKGVCLLEKGRDEVTIDLFCARLGRGTPLMNYVKNFVLTKTKLKQIAVNSVVQAWKFYWKCGFRIDLRETSPLSKIPLADLYDMKKVDRWMKRHPRVDDVIIPMILSL